MDYYQPKSVLRGFVEREKVQIGIKFFTNDLVIVVLLGEDRSVDHLVFVVHGVGPFVDIGVNSFKSLIDCGELLFQCVCYYYSLQLMIFVK